MAQSKKRYKATLDIERLDDGKYLIEVGFNRRTERLSYSSREDFFAALDQFKQQLVGFEETLDAEPEAG